MKNNQPNKSLLLLENVGYMYATATSKRKECYGVYQCECGNKFTTVMRAVNSGKVKSCGHYNGKNKTHGLSKHKLYFVWTGIIGRTTDENNRYFKNYGGRGIGVCDRWLNVSHFIEDMYPSYKEGLSIDRIDNDKGYSKDNCRWATTLIQNRNTRILQVLNTSGYRGVHFNKTAKKWCSRISINGVRKNIGYCDSALEAAKAYDRYVIDNNLEHTINGVL